MGVERIHLRLKRSDERQQILAAGHDGAAGHDVARSIDLEGIAAAVRIGPVAHGEEHPGLVFQIPLPDHGAVFLVGHEVVALGAALVAEATEDRPPAWLYNPCAVLE